MSEQDNEELDSQNQETEEVLNTEEVEETVADTETEDKPKYTESEMKSYARAKKAEAEARQLKKELDALKAPKESSEKQDAQLTPMDAIMLSKSNITEKEDIEEVVAFANFKKISISDALKNNTVKAILAEKSEQRATAEATNTGAARRGSNKLTDEQVLANAEKGKLPDDAAELANARWNQKLKK